MPEMREFMGSGYKRAVFFFPFGDRQIEEYLDVPDATTPGLVRDVSFKYCGEKLARSSEYDAWLETVPEQFRDRCQRSEKGVDVQICCDASQLAAMGHISRLFLSTNDSDFIPLLRETEGLWSERQSSAIDGAAG
jgi:uncharacterized LabA/DUF88 family protein